MGYRIKVNHSKLGSAANAIETYTSSMSSKMRTADNTVSAMLGNWQGNDANSFVAQWDKVNDADSTYANMKKSLESYAKFLRHAENKYKTAQISAINRANRLPKW